MTSGIHRRGFVAGAAGLTGVALHWAGASPAAAAPAGAALDVVSGGRARATVLWWGRGSAEFAAAELRAYVEQITGVELPVRAARLPGDQSLPEGVTGVVALRAGTGGEDTLPGSLLASAGGELGGDAPEDSFVLLGDSSYAVFTGRGDRAPLYAVYAQLELLGVRFFAPGFPAYEGHHEHVPRRGTLRLPPLRRAERPGWSLRRQYAEEGYSHHAGTLPALLDWMAKNRLNTFVFPTDYIGIGVTVYDEVRPLIAREAGRRGIRIETGGHGYDSFLPPEKFPEYYASGGPLFDIYNPEALDAYVDEVVKYLRARPEVGIFDCWPPDTWDFQQPILDRYGTPANAESVVVNRLAEVLSTELPQVRVERIAYASTIQPPDPEYASRPDVIVDYAPYTRSFDGPLDAAGIPANAEHAGALTAWRESFRGSICMYEYYRRYRWRSLPVHPVAAIAGDVAFESGLGLDGMGMYCEPADWIPYEHIQSLVAALSWDHTLDARDYLAGYLQARFGAAAARDLGRYYELTRLDPDTRSAAALHDVYGQARTALEAAAGQVSSTAARTVLDRLTRNADIAVADMYAGMQSAGSDAQAAARRAYRTLVLRNRFNGVALTNLQTRWRWGAGDPYGAAATRQQVADVYASPAAGFGDPGTLTAARSGDPVRLTVAAQDVDFRGHTVSWTATAPEGVRLRPSSGTLKAARTQVATSEVEVSATADAATGKHEIALGFSLADGTPLVPATVELVIE